MNRGQKLGGVLGLATLLSAFLLPFSSIAEGSTATVDSLLIIFKIFVIGVGNLQTVGLTQLAELAYIYMGGFVVVVLAGIIGAYARWSAFLGIVGMATLTFSPFAIFTAYSIGSTGFGVGFWAIWATSILAAVVAFWSRKERAKMKGSSTPIASSPASKTAVGGLAQSEAESGESTAT